MSHFCMATNTGWLIAKPTVPACELMDRLAAMVPDAYASKEKLRTLQRQVRRSFGQFPVVDAGRAMSRNRMGV
jgi:hypothetical protein